MSEDSNSILDSIKKLLGMTPDYDAFDTDIIIYINSAFSTLRQICDAPKFSITDKTDGWDDFMVDMSEVAEVKTYIYLKVRSIFDPPTTSFQGTALQAMITEHEARLNYKELIFNPRAYDRDDPIPDLTDGVFGEITPGVVSALTDAIVGPYDTEASKAYEQGKQS